MVHRNIMDTVNEQEENHEISSTTLGYRHVQVGLMFFLLTVGFGMRVSMSVALVAMTDNTTSSNLEIPTYNWANKGYILSSFFWGYLTLQILAGQLGKIFGSKEILMGAMLITSTSFILIPLAAQKFGSYGVIALRVVGGMSQAFFVPSVYGVLGKWVPLSERSRLGTIATTGAHFGTILALPLVGYLSSSDIGWPSAFYLFGSLGVLWIVIWYCFGAGSPAKHKSISIVEKKYIEKALSLEDTNQVGKTPWKAIFTSLPLWSIVICNIGQNWGYITLITETATYLNKVMKFDIKSDGLLSAAPYLAAVMANFFFATLADYCINNKLLSVGITRKLFTSVGCIGPAAALMVLSFLPDEHVTLSVIMIVLAVGINSAVCGGTQMNVLDLSPRYASISMGISNTVSTASALVAPIIVQGLVTDETDRLQWKLIFVIASALYVGTGIVYVIFGSGTSQNWDSSTHEEKTEEKIKTISE